MLCPNLFQEFIWCEELFALKLLNSAIYNFDRFRQKSWEGKYNEKSEQNFNFQKPLINWTCVSESFAECRIYRLE